MNFLQSGTTKNNQTGGDTNFNVRIKPDLYFYGEQLVFIFQLFQSKRKTNQDGTFQNERLFLQPLPSASFQHNIWFGNEHIGKNNVNFVHYNTSPRKLRTQALTDAKIDDWMIGESMGQKDKKTVNLFYYRKMNHEDKLLMAQVLHDPWNFLCKKRNVGDELHEDFSNYLHAVKKQPITANPVNLPSLAAVQHAPDQKENTKPNNVLPFEEAQKAVSFNNCSNVVVNVYLAK